MLTIDSKLYRRSPALTALLDFDEPKSPHLRAAILELSRYVIGIGEEPEKENERLSRILGNYMEVVQKTFKMGGMAGMSTKEVIPNALYVVDWLGDKADRFDGVKVEHVLSIEDGVVDLNGSYTDLDTFASIIAAGPFPLTK